MTGVSSVASTCRYERKSAAENTQFNTRSAPAAPSRTRTTSRPAPVDALSSGRDHCQVASPFDSIQPRRRTARRALESGDPGGAADERSGLVAAAAVTDPGRSGHHRSRDPAGRRPTRPAQPRHRHARHDAGRSHGRLRREGCADARRSTGSRRKVCCSNRPSRWRRSRCRPTRASSPASSRPSTASATTAASSSARSSSRWPKCSRRAATGPADSSAAYVLDSKWGINQGFDTYFDDFDLSQSRGCVARRDPAARPTKSSTKRCRGSSRPNGGPFFAWIHLYDAHSPYRPPEPFAVPLRRTTRTTARLRSPTARSDASSRSCSRIGRRTTAPSSSCMGDHGESLGDHGESAHGFFIYDSVTHVPFVIRAPFSRAAPSTRRRPGPVGGRDADRARPAGRPVRRPALRRQPRRR